MAGRASYPTSRPSYGTYEWFQREIGVAVGIGANYKIWDHPEVERVDSLIQRGIHRFYQPAGTGHRFQRGYQWSFLLPLTTLTTTGAYSTGTVTVVAGVATITGGTWPSWADEGDLTVNGITYTAASLAGADLTLEDLTVTAASGTTFSLTRPRYTMPSTFDGMDGPFTYQSGVGHRSIRIFPEYEVRRRGQIFKSSGYPEIAALYPVTPDAATGSMRQVKFFPAPDSAYVLEYRYKVEPTDLLPGEFPLGGRTNAETILTSCMAIIDPKLEETFIARLASAIDQDQTSHQAANLGQNLDRSDEIIDDRNFRNSYLTSYDNS